MDYENQERFARVAFWSAIVVLILLVATALVNVVGADDPVSRFAAGAGG